MIPYLVIVLSGIVGLGGWGLKGLVIGVVLGWLFASLFGGALYMVSGGLLPRQERKRVAVNFMSNFGEYARAAYPGSAEADLPRLIERRIEDIFKRACRQSSSSKSNNALERGAIQESTAALVAEESREEMKDLLELLERHIEKEMYP